MKGKTHVAVTLIALTTLYSYTSFSVNPEFVVSAVIGSYAPDADIRNSLAGRIVPAHLFVKHRGPTHSLFALGVVTMLPMCISIPIGFGLGMGYGLHLLLDSLTKMHLPYWDWYPGKKPEKTI